MTLYDSPAQQLVDGVFASDKDGPGVVLCPARLDSGFRLSPHRLHAQHLAPIRDTVLDGCCNHRAIPFLLVIVDPVYVFANSTSSPGALPVRSRHISRYLPRWVSNQSAAMRSASIGEAFRSVT
jgi:hypothetical protein